MHDDLMTKIPRQAGELIRIGDLVLPKDAELISLHEGIHQKDATFRFSGPLTSHQTFAVSTFTAAAIKAHYLGEAAPVTKARPEKRLPAIHKIIVQIGRYGSLPASIQIIPESNDLTEITNLITSLPQGAAIIEVDGTGVGDGFADILRDLGHRVETFYPKRLDPDKSAVTSDL